MARILRRYFAVEYKEHGTPRRRRGLISIYADEHPATASKFFWGDSPTHVYSLDDLVILKDYGTNYDKAYNSFDVDFPPEPVDLDTWLMALDIRGWLAPDGRLFHAEYMNHSGAADDIVRGYQIKARGYRDPVDVLYKKGWICIGLEVVMNAAEKQKRDCNPTSEQIAMLQRLYDVNADFKGYQDMIDRFFRMYRLRTLLRSK